MGRSSRKIRQSINKSRTEITLEMVMHVAKLARLNLTKKEARKYQKELSEILSAFRQLKKVKTNAKPSFQPLPISDVFRKDEIEKCLTNDVALANTKHKENGYFKGPRAV